MADNPILAPVDTVVYPEDRGDTRGSSGAATDAAKAAVDVVGNLSERALIKRLDGTIDDSILPEEDAGDPIAAAFGSAAPEDMNPLARSMMDEVARLRLGADQGSISQMEMLVRQEKILRQAITRFPMWSDRFIGAAQRRLGYNPIGAAQDALKDQSEDPRSYREKQYDQLAETLGINPGLKTANPVAYYEMLSEEADRRSEGANIQRKLDIVTRTGQLATAKGRATATAYVNVIGTQATKAALASIQVPNAQALASGGLAQMQRDIENAAVNLVDTVHNNLLENGLVDTSYWERKDTEGLLASQIAIYKRAAESADPVKTLATLNAIQEGRIHDRIYSQMPNAKIQEYVLNTMSLLQKAGPAGEAMVRDMLSRKQKDMGAAFGFYMDEAYSGFDRDTGMVLNPAIAFRELGGESLEGDATQRIGELQAMIRAANGATDQDSKKGALIAASNRISLFAQQYVNTITQKGAAPSEKAFTPWLKFMASDEFKDVGGLAQNSEVAKSQAGWYPLMGRVFESEMDLTARDVQTAISLELTGSKAVPRQGIVSTGAYPIRELIEVSVDKQSGLVTFATRAGFDYTGSGLKAGSVEKAVRTLNNDLSQRLTDLTRALAHFDGVTYESAVATLQEGVLAGVYGREE